MLTKILCFIGFHKWIITFEDGPKKERECSCCKKDQHSTYDMCYGETGWANGLHWSK